MHAPHSEVWSRGRKAHLYYSFGRSLNYNSSMNLDVCENSWLSRKSCSHCNRSPRYEQRPFIFEGNRMVEILRNGGPIHPYDSHFQFGTKKAELILAALPVIKEFATNTQEDGTTTVTSREVVDEFAGLSFRVWVEMHSDFVDSTGTRIQRPWLQVEALSADSDRRIGLGVQKAKALCAIAKELRDWVAHGKALRERATITITLPRKPRVQSSHQAQLL